MSSVPGEMAPALLPWQPAHLVSHPPLLLNRQENHCQVMMRRCSDAIDTARTVLAITMVLSLTSCSSVNLNQPDLAKLYNRSASHHDATRNPIIAIPGLLGSKLTDTRTGQVIWGGYDGISANPKRPEGLRQLALPIGYGHEPLSKLRDGIKPTGALERARIKLAGIPIGLEVYAGLLHTLGAGGYRDRTLGLSGQIDYGTDHFTCFQFSYDWRRDIVESAQELKRFVLKKRAFVRREYKKRFGIDNPRIKFDIAAHSMGGLVARYFLMYGAQDLPADGSLPKLTWEGANYVERVIFIGTPNAGSVTAFNDLVNGRKLAPLIPFFPAGLLGTYPSIYQLMARSRHGAYVWDGNDKKRVTNILDPTLWKTRNWGLASPRQADTLAHLMPDIASASDRRRRALALQARILKRTQNFQKAMDRPARPPKGLQMILVAGDGHETPQKISIPSDAIGGGVQIAGNGEGDGTVLRSSALLDEREGQKWQPTVRSPIQFQLTMFLPQKHLEITKSPIFRDNVLHWLLEDPRNGTSKSR